jgi:hypothetical protein
MSKNSDEIIYQEVKRRLIEQGVSIKSIDTKAALVLSFAGAILAGLVNSSWFNGLSASYHSLILLPLGLTCVSSLIVLLVRGYRADPDPKKLIDGYQDKTEEQTRGQLIKNYEEVFIENEQRINNKALFSKITFALLAITTIAIIGVILFTPNTSKGDTTWQMTQHQHRPYRLNQ